MRLASTGIVIVDIPVTQDGAVYIDERHTLFGIGTRCSRRPATRRMLVARRSSLLISSSTGTGSKATCLSSRPPTRGPPAGTIGIFSDGAHHFEAVALTSLGRRMFYDINGEVLTTNGTSYLTDPDGA